MSITLASLLASKFSWSVSGIPIDIEIGESSDLSYALNATDAILTLVSLKCIHADGVCIPIGGIAVLPGSGEDEDKSECCWEPGLRVWKILPDTLLPFIDINKRTLAQAVAAKKKGPGTRYASLSLSNPRLNGSVLSVEIRARWSESIAGLEIVLIDETIPVTFDFGVSNPYPVHLLDIEGPFGIPISVDANFSVNISPNRVCAELRASWPGGNVQGPHGCLNF